MSGSSSGIGDGSSSSSSSKPAAFTISSSSMLGLMAEVSRTSSSSSRGKGTSKGKGAGQLRGDSRDKSKEGAGGIFSRQNRGLQARSARDTSHMLAREDLSAEARRVLESRDKLAKKAELYEQLAKGDSVKGISREQLRLGLLVDFEAKAVEESYAQQRKRRRRRGGRGSRESSDSSNDDDDDDDDDDSDSSSARGETVQNTQKPVNHHKGKQDGHDNDDGDGEELIETIDELGRTRWIRKSQVAAAAVEGSASDLHSTLLGAHEGGVAVYSDDIRLASQTWHPADQQSTLYGDQVAFPVYEPTEDEMRARRQALNLDAPLADHFDSTKEVRTRGAGFIQLSRDDEERRVQLEQLKAERESTERARRQAEIDGDAEARRERELVDRRKLIEEKRKQTLEKRKAADMERGRESKVQRLQG